MTPPEEKSFEIKSYNANEIKLVIKTKLEELIEVILKKVGRSHSVASPEVITTKLKMSGKKWIQKFIILIITHFLIQIS